MRKDQEIKLAALSERLADSFITEANPDKWPGAETDASAMTTQQRGDRNWSLKNANQLGALLVRTMDILERASGVKGPTSVPADDTAEADIAKYEREAKRLLESMGAKRGR